MKVIYTDLDGSLLDHYSYSHAPADALLADLEQQGIPVIPCTSKTHAELLVLREELGSAHPFIFENGAAVAIPQGYFDRLPADSCSKEGFWIHSFVAPREHWLALIRDVAGEYENEYRGFADMDNDEVAQLTRLSKDQARRARQREYSEPIYWTGSPGRRQAFIAKLQRVGAVMLQGGRFLHVSGPSDKGQALHWLNNQYTIAAGGQPPLSIAAGDSHNDLAMLEAADQAVVIKSAAHPPPCPQRHQATYFTEAFGPEGWVEGMRHFLKI